MIISRSATTPPLKVEEPSKLLGRYQFSATNLTDGRLRPLRDPTAPET